MTWAGAIAAWVTVPCVAGLAYRSGFRRGFREGFGAAMRGLRSIEVGAQALAVIERFGFRIGERPPEGE